MVNYVTKKPCTGCGEAFPICYCRDYKNAELLKKSLEKRNLKIGITKVIPKNTTNFKKRSR